MYFVTYQALIIKPHQPSHRTALTSFISHRTPTRMASLPLARMLVVLAQPGSSDIALLLNTFASVRAQPYCAPYTLIRDNATSMVSAVGVVGKVVV
jgi:hypothetical protein